jgi:hypothetical protein
MKKPLLADTRESGEASKDRSESDPSLPFGASCSRESLHGVPHDQTERLGSRAVECRASFASHALLGCTPGGPAAWCVHKRRVADEIGE